MAREKATGAPDAEARTAEDSGGQVEHDLDSLLADTQRERDEYLELAQRARADFENYRKRVAREGEEGERRGRAGLAGELIPAVDNLERALRTAGIDPDSAEAKPDGLAEGVLLVHRELRAILERAGVEALDPAGEPFDPEWHEALSTRAEEGTEPGTVLEVVERGYRLDGQVLRAARVVVSE